MSSNLEEAIGVLRAIREETEKYANMASANSDIDKLLVDLNMVYEVIDIYVLPKLEKHQNEISSKT